MRNMSFALTTDQVRARTKTVTRRLGWDDLRAGEMIGACRKCQGLKKGDKVERLAVIRVVSVRRECLYEITVEDVEREGFHGMSPEAFIAMFCKHNKTHAHTFVNRIEFEYV